jgi:hypothetical protein
MDQVVGAALHTAEKLRLQPGPAFAGTAPSTAARAVA